MSWKDRKFHYPFVKTKDGDVLFHLGRDRACRIDTYEQYNSLFLFWFRATVWLSLSLVVMFEFFLRYRHDLLSGIAFLIPTLLVGLFVFRLLLRWKVRHLRLESVRHPVPLSARWRSIVDKRATWHFRLAYVASPLFIFLGVVLLARNLSRGSYERLWMELSGILFFLAAFLVARHGLRVKRELRQKAADATPKGSSRTRLSPSSSDCAGRRESG